MTPPIWPVIPIIAYIDDILKWFLFVTVEWLSIATPNEKEINHGRVSWQTCGRSFDQGPLASIKVFARIGIKERMGGSTSLPP
jgi:hypothetical protein